MKRFLNIKLFVDNFLSFHFDRVVILLLFINKLSEPVDALKEVYCEKIENISWSSPTVGSESTCYMHSSTTIDSPGFEISTRNDSIKGLYFESNKNVSYLLVKVDEKFPNLLAYGGNAPIKEITRENFRRLLKLKVLILRSSRIEKISSDTFDDLVALEHLFLGTNHLIFLVFLNVFS